MCDIIVRGLSILRALSGTDGPATCITTTTAAIVDVVVTVAGGAVEQSTRIR